MKMLQVSLTFIALLSLACNNHAPKEQIALPVSDTSKFYPLRAFFIDQIKYVDLRNFSIYRITVKDGKKDSTSLTKEQFAEIASIFLKRDLSAPEVKILYKESVFQDLSTGSITLNYKPLDNKAVVQNLDVLVDEETKMAKRIFIRSVYTKGDTTISEQCNWKTDKSFQVNRSLTARGGYTSTELNFINWNDKP